MTYDSIKIGQLYKLKNASANGIMEKGHLIKIYMKWPKGILEPIGVESLQNGKLDRCKVDDFEQSKRRKRIKR